MSLQYYKCETCHRLFPSDVKIFHADMKKSCPLEEALLTAKESSAVPDSQEGDSSPVSSQNAMGETPASSSPSASDSKPSLNASFYPKSALNSPMEPKSELKQSLLSKTGNPLALAPGLGAMPTPKKKPSKRRTQRASGSGGRQQRLCLKAQQEPGELGFPRFSPWASLPTWNGRHCLQDGFLYLAAKI